jgi:small conductance mechanosensitive channel
MNFEEIRAKVIDMTIDYAPKVLLALVTLIIGFWIIGRIVKLFQKTMENRGLDLSLIKFLRSLINIFLKVLLLLSVATTFGIETTSFIAIISALMIGVGMALNGSLGQLVSGIMILTFKPFKVGDIVTIGGGETGKVEEISTFNTTLRTWNNKLIIISNSNVTGKTITNITGQGTVGVDLKFGIGYTDDIDKARDIILRIGQACPYILDEPKQAVVVAELADSSVNLVSRPFCKSEQLWDTLFYMQEHVKKAFDKEGIGIPYPQLDVHMIGKG